MGYFLYGQVNLVGDFRVVVGKRSAMADVLVTTDIYEKFV